MHHRLIAVLIVACLAGGLGGCAHNQDYDEILMPLQTGSRINRRVMVPANPEKDAKKKKEEKKKKKKKEPEAEPSATPAPEDESTPPPVDRFR